MALKSLLLAIGIALGFSASAYAYDPIPLSPTWIKTTYSAMKIAESPVFRGKVLMINGQNSFLVEREDGSQMTVRLFHTHVTGNESPKLIQRQQNALKEFVGYTWYIRGDQKQNNTYGIFLTKDGENANMLLVYSGLYDLNTRSLVYSYEKKLMENKYKYLQTNKINPQ
ncbi:hypothetical protein MUB04_14695 [Acinetobacter indicus]|uniref:hypothetical protein n=1 Tax=Acinetobacter TaxID=469 RepID=UPI0015D1EB89|nr:MULTISPECIES: hypothetical protein [Acinetobacter]MCP0917781.1 hypothetical protein [Acinetobacter indicus]